MDKTAGMKLDRDTKLAHFNINHLFSKIAINQELELQYLIHKIYIFIFHKENLITKETENKFNN